MSLTPDPAVEVIGVFLGVSGRDVDRHDANGSVGRVGLAGILNKGRLHHADQHRAVWRQRETFHALIVGAPARVGVRSDGTLRRLKCDGEIEGKIKSLDQVPCRAVELPNVRPVFIEIRDSPLLETRTDSGSKRAFVVTEEPPGPKLSDRPVK